MNATVSSVLSGTSSAIKVGSARVNLLALAVGIALAAPTTANAVLIGELQQLAPTTFAFVEGVSFDVMDNSGLRDITAAVSTVVLSTGCNPSDFAGFAVGHIALIAQGTCSLDIKAGNAAAAGALAALIYNDVAGLLVGSLTAPPLTNFPVMGLTDTLGQQLASTSGLVMRMKVAEVASVPEPSTLALLGLGFAGLVARGRRRFAA